MLPPFPARLLPFRFRAGGPGRIVAVAGGAAALVAIVVGSTLIGSEPPPPSRVAQAPPVNPLPGGVQSNPQEDTVALRANQDAARAAEQSRQSFTPRMPASRAWADSPPDTPGSPLAAAHPSPPAPSPTLPVRRVQYTPGIEPGRPAPGADRAQQAAAQQRDQQQEAARMNRLGALLGGFGPEQERTDIIIPPPPPLVDGDGAHGAGSGARSRSATDAAASSAAAADLARVRQARELVLVPGGRGIYAHTILSVRSDAASPIVLEADTGPIAGDRMEGTFITQGDRLVVRINTVFHNGQALAADAIVMSPQTMETAVASSVDEHYLSRFVLPAAAAFVQGLGQALATTSNTTGVLSPFGGTSYLTRLNFPQQLGVGAGAAAGAIGNALAAEAPRGPTIHLDSRASVGVLFLANLTAPTS